MKNPFLVFHNFITKDNLYTNNTHLLHNTRIYPKKITEYETKKTMQQIHFERIWEQKYVFKSENVSSLRV